MRPLNINGMTFVSDWIVNRGGEERLDAEFCSSNIAIVLIAVFTAI